MATQPLAMWPLESFLTPPPPTVFLIQSSSRAMLAS